jgi:hypothetical protein
MAEIHRELAGISIRINYRIVDRRMLSFSARPSNTTSTLNVNAKPSTTTSMLSFSAKPSTTTSMLSFSAKPELTRPASMAAPLPTPPAVPNHPWILIDRQNEIKQQMESLNQPLDDYDAKVYMGNSFAGTDGQIFYVKQPAGPPPYFPKPNMKYYKIHLNFNPMFVHDVIEKIFKEVVPNFKFIHFKVINNITSKNRPFKGYLPVPMVYGPYNFQNDPTWYTLTPKQMKEYKMTISGKSSFIGPDSQEYELDTVFYPIIAFYTDCDMYDKDTTQYTKDLINCLKDVFSDDNTAEWTLDHFYPRGNVKINNMVYFTYGDYDDKIKPYENSCKLSGDSIRCDPFANLLPEEYTEIQESCSSQQSEPSCDMSNKPSTAISGDRLCKWEDKKCKPRHSIPQHIILGDGNQSIKELYHAVGQEDVYNKLMSKNGGRRTRRKHKKRLTKKKSNRHHRR